MNNRLDFISGFHDGAVEAMTDLRAMYMAMDESLLAFTEGCKDSAANRACSLARTHLESSLHYAIKTLCLVYEKKDEVAK